MAVNWNLARNYDVAGSVMQGMETGRKQKADYETRNALSSLVSNPNDQNALEKLVKYDPMTAMQFQDRNAKMQQEQQAKQSGDMQNMRKLLYTAKQNPMQAFSAAQSMGIDLSGVPQPNDPNFQTWVDDQILIVDAIEKPGGKEALSTAGKIAMDMGYTPGTPEFNAKVGEIFKADQMKTIAYQPGGGVAAYNPSTGEINPIVVPYAPQQTPQQTRPQPDEEDIQMLRSNPDAAAQFDEVFGQGASSRILQGGQTQTASGNF